MVTICLILCPGLQKQFDFVSACWMIWIPHCTSKSHLKVCHINGLSFLHKIHTFNSSLCPSTHLSELISPSNERIWCYTAYGYSIAQYKLLKTQVPCSGGLMKECSSPQHRLRYISVTWLTTIMLIHQVQCRLPVPFPVHIPKRGTGGCCSFS